LHLAEPALVLHALGVACDLDQRFDIGGDPGEAVGGALLTLQCGVVQLAGGGDLGGNGGDRPIAQDGGGVGRIVEQGDQFRRARRATIGDGFGDSQNMAPGLDFGGSGTPKRAPRQESNLNSGLWFEMPATAWRPRPRPPFPARSPTSSWTARPRLP